MAASSTFQVTNSPRLQVVFRRRPSRPKRYIQFDARGCRSAIIRAPQRAQDANRLYVDAMKWSLAEVRPKVLGDQARLHLGADLEASPVQTADAHVDLIVLSAENRDRLRQIARKLITTKPQKPLLEEFVVNRGR